MLNPLNMTRFADLLQQGAIMKQVFQPFESHLQYLLQWMCDYNLYGCAYIDCRTLKFRKPVPERETIDSARHKWHSGSIAPEWISNPEVYPRQSHCSLEVDICVQDILNRAEVCERNLHADFVERFGPMNPDEKLVHSLAGLWKDETRRRKRRMGLSTTSSDSSSPFPPEVLVSMSADSRNIDKAGWIHEDEFRERVEELAKQESEQGEKERPRFDDFVQPDPKESEVKSVLESVADLFPENLMYQSLGALDGDNPLDPAQQAQTDGVLVDEASIPQLNGDDFFDDSDEDIAREVAMSQQDRRKDIQEIQKLRNAPDTKLDQVQEQTEEGDGFNVADRKPMTDPDANGDLAARTNDDLNENETPRTDRKDSDQSLLGVSSALAQTPQLSFNKRKLSPEEKEIVERYNVSPSKRPRSRHVKFDENPSNSSHPEQSSHSGQNHTSDGTPKSSQHSQGSIKAIGTSANSSFGFSVVKDAHSSQEGSSQKQNDSTETPQKTATTTTDTSPATVDSKATLSDATTSSRSMSQPSSQALRMIQGLVSVVNAEKSLILDQSPPSFDEVQNTFFQLDMADVIYQNAYYSNEKDVPNQARDYAGREFKLESTTLPFLPEFDATGTSPACYGEKPPIVVDHAKEELAYSRKRRKCNLLNWEIAQPPPTWKEVQDWLDQEESQSQAAATKVGANLEKETEAPPKRKRQTELSQIEGPTQKNPHGFKFSQKHESTSVRHEAQYMSIMSLEVHVNTRGNFVPNPEEDEIACVFWCVKLDNDEVESNGHLEGTRVGIVALSEDGQVARSIARETGIDVETEDTELDVMNRMVDIVREFDADILTGYEVHNGSWGYLIERARVKYEYDLCDEFSRVISQSHGRFGKEADRWGFNHTSTIRGNGAAHDQHLARYEKRVESTAVHYGERSLPPPSQENPSLYVPGPNELVQQRQAA